MVRGLGRRMDRLTWKLACEASQRADEFFEDVGDIIRTTVERHIADYTLANLVLAEAAQLMHARFGGHRSGGDQE